MAERKVWSREETIKLISMYESFPEIWDSQHMLYKDHEKRSMCWQLMGEGMGTSVVEIQRKIHNLRNQVLHCTCCVLCVKWTINLYIALCM
jgi:hypothetical protein